MMIGEWSILFLFYISAVISIIAGIYLLSLNINTKMNKVAFLFCASLALWCFCTAEMLHAPTQETAFLWARIEMIGICFFYGFFLHFFLILSRQSKKVKKVITILIYAFVLCAVYFLALNEMYAKKSLLVAHTSIGYVTMIKSSEYYIFIIGISTLFFLLGIYVLMIHKKVIKKRMEQKHYQWMFLIYSLISLISICMQIFAREPLGAVFYEFLPVIDMLFVIQMMYLTNKYGFMKKMQSTPQPYYMEQFRGKIIHFLEGYLCLGGVIFFITQFSNYGMEKLKQIILFSVCLIFYGMLIRIMEKKIKNDEWKIMGYALVLSMVIPSIMFQFLKSAVITVWVFPIIIMIAALLFYHETVIVMIVATSIFSQFVIWICAKPRAVFITESDYMGRILIFGIAVGSIYYVNKVYIYRIKQLAQKIKSQDFLFQISSTMLNVKKENEKEKLDIILKLLQSYTGADMIYIYLSRMYEQEKVVNYYAYNHGSVEDIIPLDYDKMIHSAWWEQQLEEKEYVKIDDIEQLSMEAMDVKWQMKVEKIKSLLAVPLMNETNRIGYIRLDFKKKQHGVSKELVQVMKILGNLLGEANTKMFFEHQMKQMNYYDQLTNIPNRKMFGEILDFEIEQYKNEKHKFALVFLDLDEFKVINDINGHTIGDKILIYIAQKLQKLFPIKDSVCRFGGDEFLILIRNIESKQDIESQMNAIILDFKKSFILHQQEFRITVSMGISVFPQDGTRKETLIKNADLAMHVAKNKGKNQYVFYAKEMQEELQQNVLLTNHLRHAIERNEFEIYYQPQISLENNQMEGMEALLRWKHPDFGLISPSIFISLAEQTDMIWEIGRWVLQNSCIQNKLWQQAGYKPLRVSVNVSVNQLLNKKFVHLVKQILKETKLDPKWLELEITERIATQESDFVVHVLRELKNLGITLAIDDFGMEYSSLNRIRMLPIDRIKIDMYFIKNLLTEEKDKAIVDMIIKLSKKLDLRIIAEGVEQKPQLDYLREKGCDEIQGFYFFKPLSSHKIEKILRNISKMGRK